MNKKLKFICFVIVHYETNMGHYCEECGEKLVGGITPTSCDCHGIECYCQRCWDELFVRSKYTEIAEKLYKLVDGKYMEYEKNIYILEANEVPVCTECCTPFNRDAWEYY